MIAEGEPFAVVICTRNRPTHLQRLLDTLESQTQPDVEVVVVDQSDVPDDALERRARDDARLHVVRDEGRGLSRARNIGWRLVGADWVAYLDDDCVPESDWIATLHSELEAQPDVDLIMGDVAARGAPADDYLPVAVFPVSEPAVLRGRFVRPWRVAYGVAMVIRRSTVQALDGWDERFGPGVPDFPASDDLDFNYRLMRSGGSAYLTPRLRAFHDQWRTSDELVELYNGYARALGGLVAKQLRTRDPLAAAALTAGRIRGIVQHVRIGATGRSRFRLRLALAEVTGFSRGLVRGIRRSWR